MVGLCLDGHPPAALGIDLVAQHPGTAVEACPHRALMSHQAQLTDLTVARKTLAQGLEQQFQAFARERRQPYLHHLTILADPHHRRRVFQPVDLVV